MSVSILRKLHNFNNYHLLRQLQFRFLSNKDEINEISTSFGQSTILVQKGSDIQELPVIVKRINKNGFASICPTAYSKDNVGKFSSSPKTYNTSSNSNELMDILDNCRTTSGLLNIINQLPDEYLSPEVCAHAFDWIIKHETLIGLKNLEETSLVFQRIANCVLKSGDTQVLLEVMDLLKNTGSDKIIQMLCDELLLRNSDGMLNIIEICECIERFFACNRQELAEKFWIGLSDNEKEINDKNIKFVYKILPKLKVSRRLVIGILETQIIHVWYHLSPDAMSECIKALVDCNYSPYRTLQSFARWMNTNIHAVNESQLENILQSFTKLDFSNSQLEKGIERYIKAKGVSIKSETLISTVLLYCKQFSLRNHHILNGCCEFFVANHEKFNPTLIEHILSAMGHFNFQPVNGIQFWKILENNLQKNFEVINPSDLVEILLNCCVLEMYPLNFVSSIFCPHFLEKLNTLNDHQLIKARSNLKLMDATLTLENENYKGPLLPRDHSSKSIWQDGRIKRMANSLQNYMEKIAGGYNCFTKSVIIGKLPTNALYIIDILLHPPGITNFWSFSIFKDRNVYVAVLIHLPEHYDSTGEYLIGPQVMRIRQLRKLGIKVVTLKYKELAKLLIHPKQMENYLVDRMKQSLPATK